MVGVVSTVPAVLIVLGAVGCSAVGALTGVIATTYRFRRLVARTAAALLEQRRRADHPPAPSTAGLPPATCLAVAGRSRGRMFNPSR
jgi:hypothetical protein